MKKIIGILIILISGFTYSQILPETRVIFDDVKMYTEIGNNKFGKLVADKKATAEIIVFDSGIKSIVSFETSLIEGSSQLFQVRIADKNNSNGVTSYSVDTFNLLDPEKKAINFILEYNNKNEIDKFIMITTDGAVEFY